MDALVFGVFAITFVAFAVSLEGLYMPFPPLMAYVATTPAGVFTARGSPCAKSKMACGTFLLPFRSSCRSFLVHQVLEAEELIGLQRL